MKKNKTWDTHNTWKDRKTENNHNNKKEKAISIMKNVWRDAIKIVLERTADDNHDDDYDDDDEQQRSSNPWTEIIKYKWNNVVNLKWNCFQMWFRRKFPFTCFIVIGV